MQAVTDEVGREGSVGDLIEEGKTILPEKGPHGRRSRKPAKLIQENCAKNLRKFI